MSRPTLTPEQLAALRGTKTAGSATRPEGGDRAPEASLQAAAPPSPLASTTTAERAGGLRADIDANEAAPSWLPVTPAASSRVPVEALDDSHSPSSPVPANDVPAAPAPTPAPPASSTLEGRVVTVRGREFVVVDGNLVPRDGGAVAPAKPKAAKAPREPRAPKAPKPEPLPPTSIAPVDTAPKRGTKNDGTKMYDVVLSMTEEEKQTLGTILAERQREYGSRNIAATLLRALKKEV